MWNVRWLSAVWIVVASILAFRSSVDAACATARVRKSYDRLTYDERLTYRRALQLSMDRGLYIKFVEMHTEMMSEMEAHRGCMFTYWHRFFLLGFENMLRSLGPEFECVTVPYWDEVQHNARAMTGACNSMESCSLIVRDMGGFSTGIQRSVIINGVNVGGQVCVNRAPVNHFCEASSRSGASCARCMPRGPVTSNVFPPETSFAAVRTQLFTQGDFVNTGRSIENGMHNALHASLGGALATFQSPSDPLFWSHHAYVDLLLSIYLKCRVGLGVLSPTQKLNNPYAFVSCPRREGGGWFTTTSQITMRAGENGLNPMQVNQPGQALYPYFQNVPSRYYELSDVTTLGVHRYGYQMGGLTARYYTQCDAASARRLGAYDPPTNATTTTVPMTKRPACNGKEEQQDGNPPAPVPTQTAETAPAPAPAPGPVPAIVVAPDLDPVTTDKVEGWTDDVQAALDDKRAKSAAPKEKHEDAFEMEKMVCLFYDQCRGGVRDYPEAFKKTWNITEPPPCLQILEDMKAGEREQPKLDNWKQLMVKYFPCDPSKGPTNTTTNSTGSTGSWYGVAPTGSHGGNGNGHAHAYAYGQTEIHSQVHQEGASVGDLDDYF